MVGPISNAERSSFALRVKIGITVLVGVSAGLITLQGDPSLLVIVGAVVGGLVVGGLLVWYLFPDGTAMTGDNRRRR